MREALSESYRRTYGTLPKSDIGVYEFDPVQIERYKGKGHDKGHGIAKVRLKNEPAYAGLSFSESEKIWHGVIIDIEPLNDVAPDMIPKGIWFAKSTDGPDYDGMLELLISGKQKLPKKVLKFELCKNVEGVLITPRYSRNRLDFDMNALYGELCE